MAKIRAQNTTDLPQYYTVDLTEAAANGGIIQQIPTSLTTRDRTGILIHEVGIQFSMANLANPLTYAFTATTDGFFWGISQLYNAGAVPDSNAPGILEHQFICRSDVGTAANAVFLQFPITIKYDTPLLAHAASIYLFCKGNSQPNALTYRMRVSYSYTTLNQDQYMDILQTIILNNQL